MLLTLSMLLMTAAPAQGVSVRSDHAQVVVGEERYRLVGSRQPLTAVVKTGAEASEIIVEVIRLGSDHEPERGAVPLSVTIGKQRNVFPNRPRLVRKRVAKWAGETGVASFPVRYPLEAAANKTQVIRVALLRPDRGGTVGVRVSVSASKKSTLAELDKNAGGRFAFPAIGAKKSKSKARRGRSRRASTRKGKRSEKKPKTKVAMATPTEDGTTSEPEETPAATENTDGEDGVNGEDGANGEGGADGDGHADGGVVNDGTGGEEDAPTENVDAGFATDDATKVAAEDTGDAANEDPEVAPVKSGRFKVVIRNEMGTFFALQSRQLVIDGIVVHDQDGVLPYPRTVAFERSVQAGAHDVEIRLAYLGDGGILFQYVNGYTFRVNDRKRVVVPADGRLTVVISGTETGGAFAELTDKPAVRWDFER